MHSLYTTQAVCELALLFDEGDEELVVALVLNWLTQLLKTTLTMTNSFHSYDLKISLTNFLQWLFGVSLLIPGHEENGPNLLLL